MDLCARKPACSGFILLLLSAHSVSLRVMIFSRIFDSVLMREMARRLRGFDDDLPGLLNRMTRGVFQLIEW